MTTDADANVVPFIKGRNRYSDHTLTVVTVYDKYSRRTPVLVIEGGYIESDSRSDGGFTIAARHTEAVDEEGDASYVANLKGAGLVWKDMIGDTHIFAGVILSAAWDTEDVTDEFIRQHGFLKFTPSEKRWNPDSYQIEVKHIRGENND